MSELKNIFAERLLGTSVNPEYRSHRLYRSGSNLRDSQGEAVKNEQVFISLGKTPSGVNIIKSACFSCNATCEVLVFVDKQNGKVLRVEGDPDSPVTRGVLCTKGLTAKDLVENPGRLRSPLKRIGKRGEGKWESISWDEALTTIAENLTVYKEKYGPQGVAFLQGTQRGWTRSFTRLTNAFGAVNHGATGWAQCLWPQLVENSVTFGASYLESSDCENSNCILVWGTNPAATWAVKAADIMDARERGARLIVVDPHLSETAAKADVWLQLRPGTDTALGLTLLNVIIENGWYDADFVENWTVGFDQLKEHVATCTPKWGESVTRVPHGQIIKAAEMYARTSPAAIYRCLAVDLDHESIQACRAVSLLAAVTGNIDVPGGNVLVSSRGEISQNTHDFIGVRFLPEKDLPLRRGYDRFPLLCTELCPVPNAHMPTLWETIATGDPYPVKAAVIFGANGAVSYSNSARVNEALACLDFLVVADLFLTPTAQMADIVLPASSWLERNNIISSFQSSYTYTIAQQKAAVLPEARSDVDIVIDLAHRLGLGDKFWPDETALFDHLLAPTGNTLAQFIQKKRLYAPLKYYRYRENGFKTPSGKVELYSSILAKHSCEPLPTYTEPFQSPLNTPELAKDYPLIMTSGRRPFFRHTENRQNPLLREQCPSAPVRIHPDTAAGLGIAEGDCVLIETPLGTAEATAELTQGLHPDVVQTMPGWEGKENVNNLIPWGRFARGIGTVSMHSTMCRIRKTHTASSNKE